MGSRAVQLAGRDVRRHGAGNRRYVGIVSLGRAPDDPPRSPADLPSAFLTSKSRRVARNVRPTLALTMRHLRGNLLGNPEAGPSKRASSLRGNFGGRNLLLSKLPGNDARCGPLTSIPVGGTKDEVSGETSRRDQRTIVTFAATQLASVRRTMPMTTPRAMFARLMDDPACAHSRPPESRRWRQSGGYVAPGRRAGEGSARRRCHAPVVASFSMNAPHSLRKSHLPGARRCACRLRSACSSRSVCWDSMPPVTNRDNPSGIPDARGAGWKATADAVRSLRALPGVLGRAAGGLAHNCGLRTT